MPNNRDKERVLKPKPPRSDRVIDSDYLQHQDESLDPQIGQNPDDTGTDTGGEVKGTPIVHKPAKR